MWMTTLILIVPNYGDKFWLPASLELNTFFNLFSTATIVDCGISYNIHFFLNQISLKVMSDTLSQEICKMWWLGDLWKYNH